MNLAAPSLIELKIIKVHSCCLFKCEKEKEKSNAQYETRHHSTLRCQQVHPTKRIFKKREKEGEIENNGKGKG